MRAGLAITTFLQTNDYRRLEIITKSFTSLFNTYFEGPIFVVDDCSPTDVHLQWLDMQNIPNLTIVRKSENGGYAKAKNSGLKLLEDAGCDHYFLADDDMLYLQDGWDEEYLSAHRKTGIKLFSFYYTTRNTLLIYYPILYKEYLFTQIRRTPACNGCFISIAPETVDKIGYFKPLNYKIGHQDTNYIIRAIENGLTPYYCDTFRSHQFLKLQEESHNIKSVDYSKDDAHSVNAEDAFSDLSYGEFIE